MSTKGESREKFPRSYAVICKCPVCGKLHKVKMTAVPSIMPRIFCKQHEYRRYMFAYAG